MQSSRSLQSQECDVVGGLWKGIRRFAGRVGRTGGIIVLGVDGARVLMVVEDHDGRTDILNAALSRSRLPGARCDGIPQAVNRAKDEGLHPDKDRDRGRGESRIV